ncbi:hypothetical protein [Henriciella sp.]|uniref:hypothetical protein n=1 Tax=Henriciella sp. TaxID=1968823 RepID=UPI002634F56B|nr:hypothetical protein [Henriciella sp.]
MGWVLAIAGFQVFGFLVGLACRATYNAAEAQKPDPKPPGAWTVIASSFSYFVIGAIILGSLALLIWAAISDVNFGAGAAYIALAIPALMGGFVALYIMALPSLFIGFSMLKPSEAQERGIPSHPVDENDEPLPDHYGR